MTSANERGAYGRGRQIKNWEKYLPLGRRVQPFPEEKVCALCESKCDVIFPIAVKLCEPCAIRVMGRGDILKRWQRKMDLTGYLCDWCGRNTYFPVLMNSRVCNKCTVKLGNQTKNNQIRVRYGARRVV